VEVKPEKTMNLPEVKIEDLLEAGVHFGHNVRRWNPKMEDYIFGVRNNIHIFDLRITLESLNSSLVKIHETVAKSGKILFVGTKKQCAETVKELAETSNNFFVNKRWLGGTLTNWKTISNSINRLNELENIINDPAFTNSVSKKELLERSREKEKLHLNLGGIKDLNGKPDLIVIMDIIKDKLAVLEAKKLNIPIVGKLGFAGEVAASAKGSTAIAGGFFRQLAWCRQSQFSCSVQHYRAPAFLFPGRKAPASKRRDLEHG
jgi:small subunit ribosomal protein S2